ncbi:MAG: hypothetical protein ACRDM8_00355 [Gaiellaceae bacterium]
MRRWPTWLVLGTVCLLAVVAAADALRRVDSPDATATATSTQTLQAELRDEQIGGLVVYSDPGCIVHSLLLPALERNDVLTDAREPLRMCELSAAGGRFLAPGETLSPNRELIARCRGGQVEVVDASSGEERETVSGCPTAWHPDGCLTHVSAGEVLCGEHRILSEAELVTIARFHPNVVDAAPEALRTVIPTALAWLDLNVLALALEITIRTVEPQYMLVLLERERVIGWSVRFGGPMRNLQVSPEGSMVLAEGTILMDRDGNELTAPIVGEVLGWSPDDRWIVIAGQASVYLVRALHLRALNPTPRTIRLPIAARSLVWTGASVPTGSSTPG